MNKISEYVKVAEAARFLGVSQTTVRKWADAGVIPNRTLPGSGYRLFQQKDLDKFLEKVSKTAKPARTKPR
jgi:excisionase family DNA binding protein